MRISIIAQYARRTPKSKYAFDFGIIKQYMGTMNRHRRYLFSSSAPRFFF